jgi:hypothetical protein
VAGRRLRSDPRHSQTRLGRRCRRLAASGRGQRRDQPTPCEWRRHPAPAPDHRHLLRTGRAGVRSRPARARLIQGHAAPEEQQQQSSRQPGAAHLRSTTSDTLAAPQPSTETRQRHDLVPSTRSGNRAGHTIQRLPDALANRPDTAISNDVSWTSAVRNMISWFRDDRRRQSDNFGIGCTPQGHRIAGESSAVSRPPTAMTAMTDVGSHVRVDALPTKLAKTEVNAGNNFASPFSNDCRHGRFLILQVVSRGGAESCARTTLLTVSRSAGPLAPTNVVSR